jgi:transcriptional regulator with XRE-family HTH domain
VDTIGMRLKYIRKLHKLNQDQFSQKIHLAQGRLSELEQGKCKPSTETLISIAENFDIDLNWLLLGRENVSKKWSSTEEEYFIVYNQLTNESQKEILEFMKFRIGIWIFRIQRAKVSELQYVGRVMMTFIDTQIMAVSFNHGGNQNMVNSNIWETRKGEEKGFKFYRKLGGTSNGKGGMLLCLQISSVKQLHF